MSFNEDEEKEAEAAKRHLAAEMEEAEQFSDEYNSLPLVIAGLLPLLVFGSLLLTMVSASSWAFEVLLALPVIGLLLYPYFLRARVKTPLRLRGGILVGGKEKRNLIIIVAVMVLALFAAQIIFPSLDNGW